MRKFLVLVFAATVLSGCSGDEASGEGPVTTDPNPLGNGTLPEPLHWEGDFIAGADPFNLGSVVTPIPPCSQAVSSCEFYDFTVNGTFNLTATLAWGVAANDLDLYLYQGQTEISQDGINSIQPAAGLPATTQVMHASIPAGTYTFYVVIWNGAADSYTLDAEFA